jgi:hypothetical protein
MHSVKNVKLYTNLRALLVVLVSYLQIYVYSLNWNYIFYCKSWRLTRNLEHYNSYVVVSPSIFISNYILRQGERKIFT